MVRGWTDRPNGIRKLIHCAAAARRGVPPLTALLTRDLRPAILQRDRPIEHRSARPEVLWVGAEVADPLELVAAADRRRGELARGQLRHRHVAQQVHGQQRLGERRIEVGGVRRVEIREDVRRRLLLVVELKGDAAAAPRQRLRDAGVVRRRVVLDDRAAIELVRRRLDEAEN